jgi:hypothetical protein
MLIVYLAFKWLKSGKFFALKFSSRIISMLSFLEHRNMQKKMTKKIFRIDYIIGVPYKMFEIKQNFCVKISRCKSKENVEFKKIFENKNNCLQFPK